jgi:hypothetical protein
MPPPRSVTNAGTPGDAVKGQMGALSGRSTGSWQWKPLGVVQVARFSEAAGSYVKVLVA